MMRVVKRTVSMRRFFWALKTYVKTDGYFTLKIFVYLNLCMCNFNNALFGFRPNYKD